MHARVHLSRSSFLKGTTVESVHVLVVHTEVAAGEVKRGGEMGG